MAGKIEREKEIVARMIRLYCSRKHGASGLCGECAGLLEYARARLDACRYGDRKPACSRCGTPCYRADRRARIGEVMRFSGPRMAWIMPLETLLHLAPFRRRGAPE